MTARPATQLPGFVGRVAVVTGGASGIGAQVALELEQSGARVAVLDLMAANAKACDLSIGVDVGDPQAMRNAFERVADELGPPTLAVHSAGIARDAVLWKLTEDGWNDTLRVNLSGAFHVLREVAPHIRAHEDGGSVVLIGSINGSRGKFGQASYAASKAGLVGLARTAARELGRAGGRVNVVAPGLVDTPMTAALPDEWRQKAVDETVLGRMATPEDVAGMVLLLLSDRARHTTGQLIHVDGGQSMGT